MRTERIYEDDDVIIVNKPSGLLVIPDRFDPALPSLRRLLTEEQGQPIFIVHRLDKDTSGVVCFAKNETAHRYYSQQFEAHQAGKFYAALVQGRVVPESGRIESPIVEHPTIRGKMAVAKKGKLSVTDYRVSEQWALYALLQLQIHTGRTHQIRVHLQSIGHPVLCDPLYGDGQPFLLSSIKRKYKMSKAEEEERPLLSRLALHAYRLVLQSQDGREIVAEAPLPRDMAAVVRQLSKHGS